MRWCLPTTSARIADDCEKIGIRRNHRAIDVELDDALGAGSTCRSQTSIYLPHRISNREL